MSRPPGERRAHTDDDRAYESRLRRGYSFRRVFTHEDWCGTYHDGPGRYPEPDEHGKVTGGWLRVAVTGTSEIECAQPWSVLVWGTDDFYLVRRFDTEEAREAALRRMPTIVTRDALLAQGYRFD